MKLSELIKILTDLKTAYGDIRVENAANSGPLTMDSAEVGTDDKGDKVVVL